VHQFEALPPDLFSKGLCGYAADGCTKTKTTTAGINLKINKK
jgi:hypothetical protein